MAKACIQSVRLLEPVKGETFSGCQVQYVMDEQSMLDASPEMYDKLCRIAGVQLYAARQWPIPPGPQGEPLGHKFVKE